MKSLTTILILTLLSTVGVKGQSKKDTSNHIYYNTKTQLLEYHRYVDPFKRADDLRDSIGKYAEIVDWYKDNKDFTHVEMYKAKQLTYSNKLDSLIRSNRKAELEAKYKIKLQ